MIGLGFASRVLLSPLGKALAAILAVSVIAAGFTSMATSGALRRFCSAFNPNASQS